MEAEAHEDEPKKKKHTPGHDHTSKSQPAKKRRIARRLVKRRKEREEEARKRWDEYDKLPADVKKLLGPKGKPNVPRPKDEKPKDES